MYICIYVLGSSTQGHRDIPLKDFPNCSAFSFCILCCFCIISVALAGAQYRFTRFHSYVCRAHPMHKGHQWVGPGVADSAQGSSGRVGKATEAP